MYAIELVEHLPGDALVVDKRPALVFGDTVVVYDLISGFDRIRVVSGDVEMGTYNQVALQDGEAFVFDSKSRTIKARLGRYVLHDRPAAPTMRSLEQIIEEVGNARYIGQSEPVLDVCRVLAVDGRFREIAELLKGWVEHSPHSERFIRGALPRIILNAYLAPKNILTFEEFNRWIPENKDWGNLIREQALGYSLLQDAVDVIEKSMRVFAEKDAAAQ